MTIRASRGVRLLVVAAMAWLGLALCAQAAHATYGKVTIVKINKGGNASDKFTFHPDVQPTQQDFALKGGEQKTFQVECNKDSQYGSCATWNNPKLTVTEKPTAGYELKDIKCVHEQGSGDWPKEPSKDSSQADGDTTVSGSTINLKVSYWEWVKCYVTNAPKPPDQHPAIKVVKDGPATAHSGDQLTFSYTVTNPGDVPLTNVTATDDKCSPLTRTGDTSDTTLDPGDTWTYTCSYVIQWSEGDANPVVNTVTTCGMPPGGGSRPPAAAAPSATPISTPRRSCLPRHPPSRLRPPRRTPRRRRAEPRRPRASRRRSR